MKHRSPIAVFLLPVITLGIYSLVWYVKTKNEMNKLGTHIPTAWLIIVPFVSYWWLWRYSAGVEKVTGGKTSTILAFVLLFLVGWIAMPILQSVFNDVGDQATAMPTAPQTFGQPAPGFGAPSAQITPNQQPMSYGQGEVINPTADPVQPPTNQTPQV